MQAPHLEMIQRVIDRLAGNSFSYKGWAVTLSAALVAVAFSQTYQVAYAAVLPLVLLWFLDGQVLATERAFRRLYEKARLGQLEPFDMNLRGEKPALAELMRATFALPMLLFYLSSILTVVVVGGLHK